MAGKKIVTQTVPTFKRGPQLIPEKETPTRKVKNQHATQIKPPPDQLIKISGADVSEWLIDGMTPQAVKDKYVDRTPAVLSASNYKARLLKSEGCYPVKFNNFELDGSLNAEVVLDKAANDICRSGWIKDFLYQGAQNHERWRVCFFEIVINLERTKITAVQPIDSWMGRWGIPNAKNIVEKAYFSGDWDFWTSDQNVQALPVLNINDPLEDLRKRVKGGTTNFIYPFATSKELYPRAEWFSAFPWCDVDQLAPKFVKSFYDNSLGITYIIKMPTDYINKYFPIVADVRDEKQQIEQVDAWLESIKDELTTVANQHKAIAVKSVDGPTGLPIYLEIDTVEAKIDFQPQIITSDAADRKIFTAFGLGNAVILDQETGAGLNSGSQKKTQNNIDLESVAHTWTKFADILNLVRDFNGLSPDIMFLPRNIIQTTLDQSKTGIAIE